MDISSNQLKDPLSQDIFKIYKRTFGKDRLKNALINLRRYNTEFLLGQSRLNRNKEYEKNNERELHTQFYSNKLFMEFYNDSLFISYSFWKNHNSMLKYFIRSVKHLRPKTVLDVPCGSGVYTHYLTKTIKTKPNIVCVDASKHSLQYSKSLNNNIQHISFFKKDYRDISGTYDLIICGELLEHLEDPEELLRFLYERLSKNGKIFLTTALFCYAHDHIYMFRDVNQVRSMLKKHFTIDHDLALPVFEQQKLGYNIPTNYACTMRKK